MAEYNYQSQAARDARAQGESSSYCQALDESALEHAEYFRSRGDAKRAAEILTQSFAEALMGNDGD